MNILHFRTLVAVHDAPTFADAAEALYLTPAAVSQQMRHLEDTLQVELFDRSTRPPRLNAHGLRVVADARDVLVSFDRLIEVAGAVDEIAGVLTIGAATGITSRLIPVVLRRLRDNYPALQIKIEEGVTADLISRVRRRSLDAAVITEPVTPEPDMVTLPITSEQMMVLAPANSKEDDWKSLIASRPFLRLNRASGSARDQIRNFAKPASRFRKRWNLIALNPSLVWSQRAWVLVLFRQDGSQMTCANRSRSCLLVPHPCGAMSS